MFKAIFWDNDGVLVDTEHLYYQATRDVLAGVGVALSQEDYLDLFLREARGAWHIAEAQGVSFAEIAGLRERRDQLYGRLIDAAPTAIPGVDAILRRLAAHYRMAVVTSSEHFDRIHRDRGFLDLFEFVLTPADYERTKPDPEPYLRALQRSGLQSQECLVVEDSERGLRAAKAAGLTCWVVPSALTAICSFPGADRVFGSLAEVERALLSLVRTS